MPDALLALALLACSGGSPDTDSGALDGGALDGGALDGGALDGGADHPYAGHALLEEGRFYNVAHRGGALLAPEETLEAFAAGLAAGADVIELDVHGSADGVVVCMHDETVDRTTDGEGSVRSKTLAELKALDAGYWFTTDGGASYPRRGQGVTVPTLAEALAAHPDALYSIEIKQQDPPIVAEVIAAVRDAGLADRVVLGSFTDSILYDVREQAPDILTTLGALEGYTLYALPEEDVATYVPPAWLFAAPVEYAGIVLDAASVAKAHEVGVKVHAWTVNDRAEMEAVIGMGVDGIITDDPATLAAVMDERGL